MQEYSKTKFDESAPYVLTRDELKQCLKDFKIDNKSSNTRIAFLDVDARLGMFRRSDFIIIYDKSGIPLVVTERVHRHNYSLIEWFKLKFSLRSKRKSIYQEYGYDITIDIQGRYIDYTHYRGDMLNATN